MACAAGGHSFVSTQVTVRGKTVWVQMCSKCGWIDYSSAN